MGEDIMNKQSSVIENPTSEVLYQDVCTIIDQAQSAAYRAVNETLIKRNWLLGMRIQHEVLKDKRAEYGEQVIESLGKRLTERYGRGYKKSNLYLFIAFYQNHPNIFQSMTGKMLTDAEGNIFHAVIGKSKENNQSNILQSQTAKSEIVTSVTGLSAESDMYSQLKSIHSLRLSWTHYSIILQENNKEARDWYEQEAAREMWSTRTLQRNISSQYFHRLLRSQNKEAVHSEMQKLTAPLQDTLEYMKNPVVAEFLGFKNNTDYTESDLEQSIIDHLIPF